jgi:hypothetical protein
LKGHGFKGCGKTHHSEQGVSGHDFSRAINPINRGFSPRGTLFSHFKHIQAFFRSLFSCAENQAKMRRASALEGMLVLQRQPPSKITKEMIQ